MKRYLIRAGFDPLDYKKVNPDDCVWENYVGGNTGNLMFAYGVMNALQTDETELTLNYSWSFTDQEIDEINEKYDAYILPLADAFRPGFMKQLKSLTNAVRKMKIPVVVIGVAVRTNYEPDFTQPFEFDSVASEFVKAINDSGTVIGVRGNITAAYLTKLGFREGKDFVPIGCPSLYTYGMGTQTHEFSNSIEKMVVNTNGYYDVGHINEFLLNTIDSISDHYLVQQIQTEFKDMYIGKMWLPALFSKRATKTDKMIITGEKLHKLYKEDRVRYFFDIHSWINFMRQFDLFVGNRFHGSVAAVLAGVPHVMIPFNARTRELTEWHHLTSLKPEDIGANTSILDYLDVLDFYSFNKHQKENLLNYISFLEANGLDHIFKNKYSYIAGESPLEKRISINTGLAVTEHSDIVHCFDSLSVGQKIKRTLVCNLKGLKPSVIKEMSSRVHIGS